ncbi:MAG: primosomal protein N' [Candidatus Gastranaerophilales bacterium]|nr:primosomal protein N' [Candidatus Gastranaerophilales bacterium]
MVDIPNMDTRTFSYAIPDEFRYDIKIGLPVLVPFGNLGVINAYIVGFGDYMPDGIKPKAIYELLDTEPVFDMEYLKFLEWVSEYYCCTLPTVMSAAIPENFFSKTKRIVRLLTDDFNDFKLSKNEEKLCQIFLENRFRNKFGMTGDDCHAELVSASLNVSFLQKTAKLPSSKFYEALRKLKLKKIIEIENIIELKTTKAKTERYIKSLSKNTDNKRHLAILKQLPEDEINLNEFLKIAKTTLATLKKLEENKNIEIFEKDIYRNPLSIFEEEKQEDFFKLTDQQKNAVEKISKAIDNQETEPILLYGVTGSGKTEVYFNAIQKVIEKGKNVIFLAPEIPIASQLAKRLAKRFGINDVAIWHSSVSEGEKYDVYQKLRNNQIKIIAGARSAIFAPVKNLGLIIIDEEHEGSYKQTTPNPRYNAKTLAIKRAELNKASIILGSATPDVLTYYKAVNTDRVIRLPERYGPNTLPTVSIIDMKQEIYNGNKSIFSRALRNAVEQNLKDKKQTILLINRRGYATSAFCNACGHTVECKKCAIPLILHKSSNSLKCHYCNYEKSILEFCPECGEPINYYGLGTQRIEEDIKKYFPEARIARIDSDILTKKNAHIELLNDFSDGKIDILVGTQMIAKGLDNPNVTLVGVIMADNSFNFPDFRSSERGFQLLTQVAGRAGRGDFEGRVYFQTYSPDFFALQNAQKQDYQGFYNQEIKDREILAYPPFSQVIRLVSSSENEFRAERTAQEIAYRLKEITQKQGIDEKLEVLGPSSCLISKIKNEYRFQILIKNRLEKKGHFLITRFVKKIVVPEDIKLMVDIEPLDIL